MPATELFRLIKKQRWESVVARLGLFPEEASLPGKQKFGCGTSSVCLPIHNACMRNPPVNVVLALAAANGGTVKTKDSLGRLAIHFACRYGASVDIIKVLLALYPQGAAISSDDGSLPLMLACLYGNSTEVVRLILDAYPEARDKVDDSGLKPFDYASDNPSPICKSDFVRILLGYKSPGETSADIVEPVFTTVENLPSVQPSCEFVAQFFSKPGEPLDFPSAASAPDREEKKRSSSKLCVVCMDEKVSRVLVPCGHPCLCEDCGSNVGLSRMEWRCPECRGEVREAVKFFGRVVNDD